MKRKPLVHTCLFLLILILAGGWISWSESPPRHGIAENIPPNIVLIVADDLGINDLQAYRETVIETPNLSFMAANGIRFTNAYAAAPICSPSRAAIQTGLHPARLALTEHIRGVPTPEPCQPLIAPLNMGRLAFAYRTIAEALKDNNYQTAYVGKWHLGGGDYRPTAHGYDVSYAAGAQGLPNSFFPPYFNNGGYPELTSIAADDNYLTDALTTLAIETLPENDDPFFLHLNYYSPHVPIQGPPELVAKYEAILGENPDTLPRPHYAAMVERIDEQVGRLLVALEQRSLLDNTVVLLTSDHGALTVEEVPGFDEHTPPNTSAPLRDGKGYLYEGGIRVPLIAYGPGLFGAAVESHPTTNTDFFPTFTHLACAPESTPDGAVIPILTDTERIPRELFWHFPHYSPQRGLPGGAILDHPYKLIERYAVVDTLLLFQLEQDTSEQTNLASEQPERAEELRDRLDEWRVSVGARRMTPNPGYDAEDCE